MTLTDRVPLSRPSRQHILGRQARLSEQMSRRVRALCGAVNFWAIIMYNLVSLNSLEFTELVARRLLLTGKGRGREDTGCAPPHTRAGTSNLPNAYAAP